jgi:hypothetical protein
MSTRTASGGATIAHQWQWQLQWLTQVEGGTVDESGENDAADQAKTLTPASRRLGLAPTKSFRQYTRANFFLLFSPHLHSTRSLYLSTNKLNNKTLISLSQQDAHPVQNSSSSSQDSADSILSPTQLQCLIHQLFASAPLRILASLPRQPHLAQEAPFHNSINKAISKSTDTSALYVSHTQRKRPQTPAASRAATISHTAETL